MYISIYIISTYCKDIKTDNEINYVQTVFHERDFIPRLILITYFANFLHFCESFNYFVILKFNKQDYI